MMEVGHSAVQKMEVALQKTSRKATSKEEGERRRSRSNGLMEEVRSSPSPSSTDTAQPLDSSNLNMTVQVLPPEGGTQSFLQQLQPAAQISSTPEQQQLCSATSVSLSTNSMRTSSPHSFSKEQSTMTSKPILPNFVHQTSKAMSMPMLIPLPNELKCLVPPGSAQQQALQQQALHQAALHQQALKNHASTFYHHSSSNQPQQHQALASQRQGFLHHKDHFSPTLPHPPKMEPVDNDRVSYSGCHDLPDTRKGSEVESRTCTPLRLKESDLASRAQNGSPDCCEPQLHSTLFMTGSGVFTDLNDEPLVTSAVMLPQVGQPECSRTTPEEKRQRKKQAKDHLPLKEGVHDHIKALDPRSARPSIKGEKISEWGAEAHANSSHHKDPSTREDNIKNLKAGLIHVARRMPKNAHAHFALGLMHQRLGQPSKAASAFLKASELLEQADEESWHNRSQFLAIVRCHHAQSLLQNSVGAKTSLAEELQQNELDTLLKNMIETLQKCPGHALVWNTLGLILLQGGHVQNAIFIFNALLSMAPNCLDALANLGVAYLHSGHLPQASCCLQSLLEKDSSHPGALVNYSVLLLRHYGSNFAGAGAGAGKGAYSLRVEAALAAEKCLITALKADSKADHIWANLAAAYAGSSNFSNACKCLEQASRLGPNRLATRYAVAMQRVHDAQFSQVVSEQLPWAANEMASILKSGHLATIQPCISWAGLAMVNKAQHETAAAFEADELDLKEFKHRACQTLQQAVVQNPHDFVQWHQLGLHTLGSLQFNLAQIYIKMAIFHRQTCAAAWSNLGIALHLSEDSSMAERVYQKALSLVAHEQAHSILSNLGNLYRQQERFADAHKAFEEALKLCPNYAPACNNLGLLCIAEGKLEEAIGLFDRALLADPLLDAAKSNKMKTHALMQIRNEERVCDHEKNAGLKSSSSL